MTLGLVWGGDGVWMLDSGGWDLCRFCGTVGQLGVTGVSGDAKGVVGGWGGGALGISWSDAGGVEISNVCGPVCGTIGAGPGGIGGEGG